MMDSEQFAKYFNAAGTNAGNGTVFTDEIMKRIVAYKQGTISEDLRSGPRLAMNEIEHGISIRTHGQIPIGSQKCTVRMLLLKSITSPYLVEVVRRTTTSVVRYSISRA